MTEIKIVATGWDGRLTDYLRMRLDDRVGKFAIYTGHFTNVTVENRRSVFIKLVLGRSGRGWADLVHGFEEYGRVVSVSAVRRCNPGSCLYTAGIRRVSRRRIDSVNVWLICASFAMPAALVPQKLNLDELDKALIHDRSRASLGPSGHWTSSPRAPSERTCRAAAASPRLMLARSPQPRGIARADIISAALRPVRIEDDPAAGVRLRHGRDFEDMHPGPRPARIFGVQEGRTSAAAFKFK